MTAGTRLPQSIGRPERQEQAVIGIKASLSEKHTKIFGKDEVTRLREERGKNLTPGQGYSRTEDERDLSYKLAFASRDDAEELWPGHFMLRDNHDTIPPVEILIIKELAKCSIVLMNSKTTCQSARILRNGPIESGVREQHVPFVGGERNG